LQGLVRHSGPQPPGNLAPVYDLCLTAPEVKAYNYLSGSLLPQLLEPVYGSVPRFKQLFCYIISMSRTNVGQKMCRR